MIPFQQSEMYSTTPLKAIGFILHGTMGSYSGAVNWLTKNRPNPSSAHYVIGKQDGQVIQLVKENQTAWHAGTVSNPQEYAKSVLPKTLTGGWKNPNASFIGIEFEYLQPGDTLTEWQYSTATNIIKNSGITNPIILSHKEITDYKGDFTKANGEIDLSVVHEISRRLYEPEDTKAKLINLRDEFNTQLNKIISSI